MQKKSIAMMLALVVSGSSMVWAAAPTLADKSNRVDTAVYGEVQSGALADRVMDLQRVVYGGKLREKGIAEQVDALYDDVVRSSTTKPSLVTRVSTLEWQLQNQISRESLTNRVDHIEQTLYGNTKPGALETRILNLEKQVYENRHYELKEVQIPANTVFKISLDEMVGTKISRAGDEVHFSVAQDVFVDDALVLPKGAQGIGVVTKVKKPGSFGRQGEVKIDFNQVFSIDDEPIATVLGAESQEKLKREAAAVGASAVGALALGPIGLVGGYFVKGSHVEIAAGTELYIQVQDAVTTHGVVSVDGAPQYTAADIVVTEESVPQKGETNAESKDRMRSEGVKKSVPAELVKETRNDDGSKTLTEAGGEQDGADTAGSVKEKVTEKTDEILKRDETVKAEAKDAVSDSVAAVRKKAQSATEKVENTVKETADRKADVPTQSDKAVVADTEEEHLPVVIIRQE